MAYTALESMRRVNRKRFGEDVGPWQPPFFTSSSSRNGLKASALRFLRCRCERLRFDPEMEKKEKEDRVYYGTSLKPGQIPYNMQMDINRLCLEKSLEIFIDSGIAEDAYAVYFCFLQIFFGGYAHSKKMVELLSEYESNGSSLLMKHRDHYSHSVYVFALGLALYDTNKTFRDIYKSFYGLGDKKEYEAANHFLEFWGLTSLFHDIGYPFELPFEEVLSYFEVDNKERGEGCIYLAYRAIGNLIDMDNDAKEHFAAEKMYGRRFETSIGLLAHDVWQKLGAPYGFEEADMLDVLNSKPSDPASFGYYMDHAYFSAARLYKELAEVLGVKTLGKVHVDALSAILLHNSLFKFAIAKYKHKDKSKRKAALKAELHPLAWLLMLCDELQCWDRTAYGRNSRKELHPMAASFDFSNSAVTAFYDYDRAEKNKFLKYQADYAQWLADPKRDPKKEPRLKAYSDMECTPQRFTDDIRKIVDTSFAPLKVTARMRTPDRKSKHTYLSSSNFLHLFDFAVVLHGRRMKPDTETAEMEARFSKLSLEYQLSTLNRARHFARYLEAIRCFYTDKPVAYDLVTRFGKEDAEVFAPMEHGRWLQEHQMMGWKHGTFYKDLKMKMPKKQQKAERAALREQLRVHQLVIDDKLTDEVIRAHYETLSERDKDKDWKPFNNLLKLLQKFDGLRIYRL